MKPQRRTGEGEEEGEEEAKRSGRYCSCCCGRRLADEKGQQQFLHPGPDTAVHAGAVTGSAPERPET